MKLCALIAVFSLITPLAQAEFFGQDFVMPRGGEYSLTQVFTEMKKDEEKKLENIVVEGEITSVCQMKGCWVSLKEPGESKASKDSCDESAVAAKAQKEMRVMFNGHSFSVPKDLSGRVLVRGTVKKKKLSKYQMKHFLKDMGCSKDKIKSINSPVYKYQMNATGLKTYES